MDEYRVPYLILFNRVTDALDILEQSDAADVRQMLIRAQQEAEADGQEGGGELFSVEPQYIEKTVDFSVKTAYNITPTARKSLFRESGPKNEAVARFFRQNVDFY